MRPNVWVIIILLFYLINVVIINIVIIIINIIINIIIITTLIIFLLQLKEKNSVNSVNAFCQQGAPLSVKWLKMEAHLTVASEGIVWCIADIWQYISRY